VLDLEPDPDHQEKEAEEEKRGLTALCILHYSVVSHGGSQVDVSLNPKIVYLHPNPRKVDAQELDLRECVLRDRIRRLTGLWFAITKINVNDKDLLADQQLDTIRIRLSCLRAELRALR
jgi:hypothetical protein